MASLRPTPARRPLLVVLIVMVLLALGLGEPSLARAQDTEPGQSGPQVDPPPAYTPAPPGAPLPGQDYPPPSTRPPVQGSGLPGSGLPGLTTQARPAGIDLDVTFIERTPRYERYQVEYDGGRPHLAAAATQRWPAPGELVTFTAHIANKGTQCSGPFRVAWFLDGVPVQENASPGLCLAGATLFTWQWTWPYPLDGERVAPPGGHDHTVRVVVDPDDAVPETFEANNALEDHTTALAFYVALAPEAYAVLENSPVVGRSASAEDWLQRHAQAFNAALAASVSPLTPDGVPTRIRLDLIEVASSDRSPGPGYDGYWYVGGDYRTTSDYYRDDEDLDWGLLHEWGHQLGLIDTYRYNISAAEVEVLRRDGSALGAGYNFPGNALMETVGSKALGDYLAAALAQTQGLRRGYYGEYQYALGDSVGLQVRDRDGCAVPDAAVAFYLRDAQTGIIDNTPEFVGSTDAGGAVTLSNRPAGETLTTATGFRLHDNPFGPIDVVGYGNLGLIKLQTGNGPGNVIGDREHFAWLSVPDLNLDFWRKGGPATQTVHLALDYPAAGPACDRSMFDDSFDGPALDGGWRWLDPNGNADVALDVRTGQLVLRLYGGGNDLAAAANFAAPRLLQRTGGNFDVTLGVAEGVTGGVTSGDQGAGLLLWQDAANFVRFERASVAGRPVLAVRLRTGGVESQVVLAELGTTPGTAGATQTTTVALRVRRDGDRFRFAYQLPGAPWVENLERTLPLAGNLLAGPVAESQHSSGAWEARFDFLAWERPLAGLSMPASLSVARAGKRSAALRWQDANAAELGFRIERSVTGAQGPWMPLATLPPDTAAFVDAAAPCGATLFYRVFAYDAAGDSPTSPASTPFAADCTPVAPDGVAAVQPVGGNQTDGGEPGVQVRWRDLSTDETGFAVQRSDDDGQSWPVVGIAAAGTTAWTDATAACGGRYLYRVAAVNDYGSAPGPAVEVVTPGCGVSGRAVEQLFLPLVRH